MDTGGPDTSSSFFLSRQIFAAGNGNESGNVSISRWSFPPGCSPPKNRLTRRSSLRMYPFGMILAWCRSGGHKIRNVFFPCLLACLSWLAWLLTVANLFFMGDKHWPLCSARLVVLCQGDFRNDFSLSGGVKVVIRGWHFRN